MKLLHHGIDFKEFEAHRSETDYFHSYHTPCQGKANQGYCAVIAILADNRGRIILNIRCLDCGKRDALKVSAENPSIETIYLSPSLKSRIGQHKWDDE